ncbi:oxygenase MpaB family protein [Kineococcus sp. SYSU DK018]|uniref:oxygenase MpaB family protein n=1 Tax=Kineococcus sp. SYSU DK018 TaxID=3383139 RepID=UPI003D7C8964
MPVHPPTSPPGAATRPPSVSARLHDGPVLEVALLTAGLLEELHPLLRELAARDPRAHWQRAASTAALLRAVGADPCRALALAARERALDGDVHVRAEGSDPDTAALRHALRVACVLRTAAAAGRAPEREDAERYVREQSAGAVLLGAEPDDLPGCLAEVDADLERVRRDATGAPEPGPLRPVGADGAVDSHGDRRGARGRTPLPAPRGAPRPWVRATGLAVALLPGWARELFTGAPEGADLGGDDLRAALVGLPSLEAAAGFRPRP